MVESKYRWMGFALLFCLFLSPARELFAGDGNLGLLDAPATTVCRFGASAREEDGQVRVYWQTTNEFGISAFRVLRQRNGGVAEQVGAGYVRAHGNEEGSAYELDDPLVRAGDTVGYELLSMSPCGPDQRVAKWCGVIRTVAAPSRFLEAAAMPAETSTLSAALVSTWIGSGERVRVWTNSLPADRVRFSLKTEGIYRVTAQELADASGWDVNSVSVAITSTNLSLICQGFPVAWLADDSALLFYGVPAKSRFAPENVYWISQGPGIVMTNQFQNVPAAATTNAEFTGYSEQQGTTYLARVSYSTLADSEAPYTAFTPLLLAGDTKVISSTCLSNCATGDWTGTVTVNLLSYYEEGTDEHTARISVGSTTVGEATWSGEQYVSFTYPFSSSNLTGTTLALTLTNCVVAPINSAIEYNARFLCLSYTVTYPKNYQAERDTLSCTGGTNNTVSIAGFSTNDVLVLEVTDTNRPTVLLSLTLTCDDNKSWSATFPCEGSGHVYRAFSKSAGTLQPSVRGVRDTDWSAVSNAADEIILIPPEAWRDGFRQVLQPLADFRNTQGLRTRIVDIEDLYNAFSDGLVDPLAIRAFCAAVHPHGLTYLLLAGAGSLDFKQLRLGLNDYTACLIPTLISGQCFDNGIGMTVALDAALGDIDNDGIPEVAIGRLPTTKTTDVAVVVQKTLAYESGLRWKEQAYVAADWDNVGSLYYPFNAGTDRLLVPLSSNGRSIVKQYLDSAVAGAAVRVNSLFPALQTGVGLFHFFGHGNETSLGGGTSRLLYNENITAANWQKPTVMVAICCRPNRWQSLTTTVCILPYGLFASDTGFVAALGATGNMLADDGESLAGQLYSGGDMSGTRRLGDLWLRGMQRMADTLPSERLLCYSLIGDPALIFDEMSPAKGTVMRLW